MLDGYLLVEKQPGFFGATPRFLLFHEEIDRQEAYRQNTVRRHVLEEAGRIDTEGEFAIFRHVRAARPKLSAYVSVHLASAAEREKSCQSEVLLVRRVMVSLRPVLRWWCVHGALSG